MFKQMTSGDSTMIGPIDSLTGDFYLGASGSPEFSV
jgi:hypothetical protein